MDTDKRPVLTGLIALVTVAVVVGVLGGLAVLVGVKTLGFGDGGDSGTAQSSPTNRLVLPEPTATSTSEGDESSSEATPSETPSESEKKDDGIDLWASQTSASAMQQIDLTGTYPAGEGAILQVQRKESGEWTDFPVTMSVSGQSFSTYVQTSQPGPNKFRVIDTDNQKTSNPVTITVG